MARDPIYPLDDWQRPMYAQIVSVQLWPGTFDEALRAYRDEVLPAVREGKGFNGAQLLADPAGLRCLVISLWESRSDLEAFEQSGLLQMHLESRGILFRAPPMIESMEINALE